MRGNRDSTHSDDPLQSRAVRGRVARHCSLSLRAMVAVAVVTFGLSAGCRLGTPKTPPPSAMAPISAPSGTVPAADGSLSYAADPNHPLVQQAAAIRQSAMQR